MSQKQPNDDSNDLSELSDDQMHAEYSITQETLAYHKKQVGHVSAQLHELTLKLAQKKKERDVHVAQYDKIRHEFTRRRTVRKTSQQS